MFDRQLLFLLYKGVRVSDILNMILWLLVLIKGVNKLNNNVL